MLWIDLQKVNYINPQPSFDQVFVWKILLEYVERHGGDQLLINIAHPALTSLALPTSPISSNTAAA